MAVCWQIVSLKQISDMICHHCIGPYIHSANYNPPSMLFIFTQSFLFIVHALFYCAEKYIFTVEKLMCCSCEHFQKQLSQPFVLICSSVHPLDPFSHPFCSYLFPGDSGSLQGTHKVSENTRFLNVGDFWIFFVQFLSIGQIQRSPVM